MKVYHWNLKGPRLHHDVVDNGYTIYIRYLITKKSGGINDSKDGNNNYKS